MASLAVRRTFRRLRELLVVRQGHVPSQLDQDRFHIEIAFPLLQARQLGRVNLASPLIDARYVDFGHKGHDGRLVGVAVAAVDLEGVYAVLVDALLV